jgi:hypothetical protein
MNKKRITFHIALLLLLFANACSPKSAKPNPPVDANVTPTPRVQISQTAPATHLPTLSPTAEFCPLGDTGTRVPPSFFPTATPTWIDYEDPSVNVFAVISREIYYKDLWDRCNNFPSTDFIFSITRDGVEYQLSVTSITGEEDPRQLLHVRYGLFQDLDLDNEKEFVLYVDTRGASCCTGAVVVYYDFIEKLYKTTNGVWRKYTLYPRLEDVDADGIPEFTTCDTDFNYAVGGFGAANALSPIRIYKYRDHSLLEVTAEFPARVEQNALYWLNYIRTDPKPVTYLALSAYLADMYVLRRSEEGIQVYDQICQADVSIDECEKQKAIVIQAIMKYGYDH